MPKEPQYSVPTSAFGRLEVKGQNSTGNSEWNMPVNTRSMQRLSSTPQGPSSQVRPGASRGMPQYRVSQSAMMATGISSDADESSDEGTEDEDDDEEEDEEGGDGSDAESDDSDDDDDPTTEIRQIFAIAEPSGLVPEVEQAGVNEAS